MMNTKRINWDEYALQLAQVAALRSPDPHQQVGACGLNHENRVVGVAYNGLAPGKDADHAFWADRDGRRPFVIHAETNLLAMTTRGECKIIACTLLPCASCATAIAAHGIKRVVFQHVYQRDTRALDIFKFYDIECVQINADSKDT